MKRNSDFSIFTISEFLVDTGLKLLPGRFSFVSDLCFSWGIIFFTCTSVSPLCAYIVPVFSPLFKSNPAQIISYFLYILNRILNIQGVFAYLHSAYAESGGRIGIVFNKRNCFCPRLHPQGQMQGHAAGGGWSARSIVDCERSDARLRGDYALNDRQSGNG